MVQVTEGMLIIFGLIQFALIIVAIYLVVYFRMLYNTRISLFDILVIAIQMQNLIYLYYTLLGNAGDNFMNREIYIFLQGTLIIFLLVRYSFMIRASRKNRQNLLTVQSIRETIDHLPGGICFSAPSGVPIMTNYKMNELIYKLTSHTVMNARATWLELCQYKSYNGCVKLDKALMDLDNESREPAYDGWQQNNDCREQPNWLFFKMPEGNIWRFRREEMTDQEPPYVQLEATEITDLYQYSIELSENNQKLSKQHMRQRSLLDNIVEINHEKEILSSKMRIHDDLGISIITTKKHLFNQTLSANIQYLIDLWKNTIRNLTDFVQRYEDIGASPETELLKVADMIGCEINFIGDQPAGYKAALLYFAAVREALTNAVRHVGADCLNVATSYVEASPSGPCYHVEISDNGSAAVYFISLGNGLSNLRKRLEQEGATLDIKCIDGVTLIIDIPA